MCASLGWSVFWFKLLKLLYGLLNLIIVVKRFHLYLNLKKVCVLRKAGNTNRLRSFFLVFSGTNSTKDRKSKLRHVELSEMRSHQLIKYRACFLTFYTIHEQTRKKLSQVEKPLFSLRTRRKEVSWTTELIGIDKFWSVFLLLLQCIRLRLLDKLSLKSEQFLPILSEYKVCVRKARLLHYVHQYIFWKEDKQVDPFVNSI